MKKVVLPLKAYQHSSKGKEACKKGFTKKIKETLT